MESKSNIATFDVPCIPPPPLVRWMRPRRLALFQGHSDAI